MEAERQEFLTQISAINPADIVYVDESGFDDNMVPLYGWAPIGERSYAEQPGFKKKRLSIVAGYAHKDRNIIAPFEYDGYTDAELFNTWFEQQLLPELSPGKVVILDNASFHKSSVLQGIAAKYGVKVLYLPAYSPDLNPIEKFWANLKKNIRKIIKSANNLQEAITTAFRITLSC